MYELPETTLPSEEISSLISDSYGHLWAGTDSGLHKFDGMYWESYIDHPGRYALIDELAIDQENRIWSISLFEGLQVIDNGKVETIDVAQYSPWSLLATDNTGQVWIGNLSNHEIAPLGIEGIGKGIPWVNTSGSNKLEIRNIAFDSDGNMWVGYIGGIQMFDGEQWQDYTPIPNRTYKTITFDRHERLWVSLQDDTHETCTSRLMMFDSQQWTEIHFPYPPTDIYKTCLATITSIAFDAQDRMWITFEAWGISSKLKIGLGMYDDDVWTFYDTSDVLDPLSYETGGSKVLLLDQKDTTWVGVHNMLVSINGQIGSLNSDPVPDKVINLIRISYRLAWASGSLAVFIAAVAISINSLNTRRAQFSMNLKQLNHKYESLYRILLVGIMFVTLMVPTYFENERLFTLFYDLYATIQAPPLAPLFLNITILILLNMCLIFSSSIRLRKIYRFTLFLLLAVAWINLLGSATPYIYWFKYWIRPIVISIVALFEVLLSIKYKDRISTR